MRSLILSDIHANLIALRAVLEDAENRNGFDIIWCLGDTVGYGPDPVACVNLLRRYDLLAVAGNHDHAAIGKIPLIGSIPPRRPQLAGRPPSFPRKQQTSWPASL